MALVFECKFVSLKSLISPNALSDFKSFYQEKKPYVDIAAERKAEYEKALETFNDEAENEDVRGLITLLFDWKVCVKYIVF